MSLTEVFWLIFMLLGFIDRSMILLNAWAMSYFFYDKELFNCQLQFFEDKNVACCFKETGFYSIDIYIYSDF